MQGMLVEWNGSEGGKGKESTVRRHNGTANAVTLIQSIDYAYVPEPMTE